MAYTSNIAGQQISNTYKYTVSASHNNADAWTAFDGVATPSSGWNSGVVSPDPAWLKIDFGRPKTITKFLPSVVGDMGRQRSTEYYFQGSNDDIVWDNLVHVTDGRYSGYGEQVIPSPGSYRYYRFYSVGHGEFGATGVEEMYLYENGDPLPFIRFNPA